MKWALLAVTVAACTKPPPAVSHAAIAFRDEVPGYQKLASEKYALHDLEKTSESVEYVAAITTAAEKHATVCGPSTGLGAIGGAFESHFCQPSGG